VLFRRFSLSVTERTVHLHDSDAIIAINRVECHLSGDRFGVYLVHLEPETRSDYSTRCPAFDLRRECWLSQPRRWLWGSSAYTNSARQMPGWATAHPGPSRLTRLPDGWSTVCHGLQPGNHTTLEPVEVAVADTSLSPVDSWGSQGIGRPKNRAKGSSFGRRSLPAEPKYASYASVTVSLFDLT
jgi:hypothetical protein